jgi:hypothetical protein
MDFAYAPVTCECVPPHLFDKPALRKWVNQHRNCPLSRQPCGVIDDERVEEAAPGILQYIIDNNVCRPAVLVSNNLSSTHPLVPYDDSDFDSDDDALPPNFYDVRNAALNLPSGVTDAPFTITFTVSYLHDHDMMVRNILAETVSHFNRHYLFMFALFNQPVHLFMYRCNLSGGTRYILRRLRDAGVFVYSFSRQNDYFIFAALRRSTSGHYVGLMPNILHIDFTGNINTLSSP